MTERCKNSNKKGFKKRKRNLGKGKLQIARGIKESGCGEKRKKREGWKEKERDGQYRDQRMRVVNKMNTREQQLMNIQVDE